MKNRRNIQLHKELSVINMPPLAVVLSSYSSVVKRQENTQRIDFQLFIIIFCGYFAVFSIKSSLKINL